MNYRRKEPSKVTVTDEERSKLLFSRFDSFGNKTALISYIKTYVKRMGYRGVFTLTISQDGGHYSSKNITVK